VACSRALWVGREEHSREEVGANVATLFTTDMGGEMGA
jgi:hypothetical protein